jgi:hypothetical protein
LGSSFDIFEPPITTRGIVCKRYGGSGGFSEFFTKRRCPILRFRSSGSNEELQMKKELDQLFWKTYEKNNTKYSHEAFLELRWVLRFRVN